MVFRRLRRCVGGFLWDVGGLEDEGVLIGDYFGESSMLNGEGAIGVGI